MDNLIQKVLIVDDEPAFRKFLKTIIEKELKIEAFEAKDPIDAFDFLEKFTPNLIILDMEMPVMDGFTALIKLRSMPDKSNIPVIACTALSSSSLLRGLLKLNISDYIVKPSNAATILAKIKKALNNY
ncbi:MAG TPA: response regulator [Candidatus Kapabacteria bacterium]|nr:response regulator [Candidatus Kapabacteria bacterium]HPO62157.1 response regulator [Candidatus Kapabacteria bacterium]